MYPRLSRAKIDRGLARAEGLTHFDASLPIPSWYFCHWHYLPEGYLSRRGAWLYDRLIRPIYYAGHHRQVHRRLASLLATAHPARVLDVGSGTGAAVAAIGEAFPDAALAGIDLSPYLLERARERCGRASLQHADAADLPFEDGHFDLVTAFHVVGHVPRGAGLRMVQEMARVLAPGGRIALLEHVWHPRPALPAGLRPLTAVDALPGILRLQLYARD